MTRIGGNAQDRRRARRASERRQAASLAQITPQFQAELDELVAAAGLPEELGGKPNPGTAPDKRLKRNKGMEVEDSAPAQDSLPEDDALAALDAFAEATAPNQALEGLVENLSVAQLGELAERAQARARAILAAAGDVAWGPEDGFVDLLCDVNESLGASGGDGETMQGGLGLRAIDAGVRLDKVLLCDYDGDSYYVAPMTIDEQGEPHLGDRDSWIPVEQGWVETDGDEEPMAASARMRFELRDVVFADGATTPTIPDAHKPGERLPKRTSRPVDPTPPAGAGDRMAQGQARWTALFVPEATLTDDGRAFAPGALEWRDLPLTLMGLNETSAEGGHDGAVACGRIDRVWRVGNEIHAEGVFSDNEVGTYYATNVGDGTIRGLSVDIAIHEYEVGPKSDYFDESGGWLENRPEREDAPEPSLVDLLFGEESEEPAIFVITKGVIGMATVCPFPAFAEASISLQASGAVWRYSHQGRFAVYEVTSDAETTLVAAAAAPAALDEAEVEVAEVPEESVTAAAAGLAPVRPPAEWFENPEFDELTALTVTDDGRIYGHAWAWDTCHIAFPDSCVTAPHSRTQNAYFHLGEIECEGGERVAVGKVTLDTGHAGQRLSRADAVSHYDHTGTVAAHIVCGEDAFGGWFSGAISPDLSEEKLRLLRGASLSGDWRGVNGNLELVALLAVNVPGFPVPRVRALVASGDDGAEALALTAAGIVLERTQEDDFREIEALAAQGAGDFDDLVAQAQG